eukprot:GILI01009384.1.p1 GENE.GILI01009384.1~~GILI01009384.1.p1  ORF type:complete len:321 (+),score=19.31 GILI01009384.1:80-964(+)
MATQFAPMLIGRPLEGIWHTAVVAFGKEYYFDGGVGIVSGAPGATRFGPPRRSEVLGFTSKSQDAFEKWNTDKVNSNYFGPESYILMERNCNHYTQEACQFLLGTDIPDDVRLMIPTLLATPLGQMIGPMLQQMVTGQAGVNGGIGATPFGAFLGTTGGQQAPLGNQSRGFGEAVPPSVAGVSKLDSDTQESLDIYLALIVSDDASASAKKVTLEALERILNNIYLQPTNPHYQRISRSSEFFKTKVAPFPVGEDLLTLAGFEPDGETHLHFKGSAPKLDAFIDAIKKSYSTIA